MSEGKDPAIKLFGKTIPLRDPVADEDLPSSLEENSNSNRGGKDQEPDEVWIGSSFFFSS